MFMADYYSTACICRRICLSIPLLMGSGCFCLLAIVKDAVVNIFYSRI